MSCPTCSLIRGILMGRDIPEGVARPIGDYAGSFIEERVLKPAARKVKGKVSAYNREYKKQYARISKSSPRMSFKSKVKKAHAATKRARK